MKNKLLHTIIMLSKYSFFGIVIQLIIINLLWATNIKAQQQIKSVKDAYVEVEFKEAKLHEVFTSLEKMTNYHFFYHKSDIDKATRFTISHQKISVGDLLLKISRDYELSFKQLNENISVKKSKSNVPQSQNLEIIIQTRSIHGKVTSFEDGEGLPGVNVIEKGTSNGTVTNIQGEYSLEVSEGATLVFSSVGYTSEEVVMGNQSVIDLAMLPDIQQLQELVVIGYGTQKKSDLTGSIASIKGSDLTKRPVSSFEQAIQGRVPGVLITQNSGEPGGATSFKIRGIGSFGSSEPLYVIDGVIMNANNETAGRTGWDNQAPNALSSLNPNDIESIEVLKDAAATAIYGTRAGNGVVLISTKRGKEGKSKVTFDTYLGIQEVDHYLDLMNAQEYAAFNNEAFENGGKQILFSNPQSLGEGTDWQREIYRTAPMQNYQLSLSGGSAKNQYYISGGYMDQKGIMNNSGFNRYSFRVNTDNQLSSNIKIGNSLTLSRTFHNTLPTNNFSNGISVIALVKSPTIKPKNADGSWGGPSAEELNYVGNFKNPLRMTEMADNKLERIRGLGNLYAEVDILKGLRFRTNLGIDYLISSVNVFEPKYKEDALENTTSTVKQSKSTTASILFENTLNYTATIADKHSLQVMVGYTSQEIITELVSGTGQNPMIDELRTLAASNTDRNTREVSGTRSESAFLSALGRVNYSFRDKYYLSGSVRRDGSSAFTEKHKYGIFPAVSAGWKLSEEPFMQRFSFINLLKVRGSYGEVGIDARSGGSYQIMYGNGMGYPLGGRTLRGFALTGLPSVLNEDLKWETARQFNIGLDLGLLEDKFTLVADYYVKKNVDMIVDERLPIYLGVINGWWYENPTAISLNSAEIKNSGVELGLNYRNVTNGFSYDIGANITTIENVVTKLDKDILGGDNVGGSRLTITQEGRSIGEFYGWVVDGVFQTQEEIDALNTNDEDGNVIQYQTGAAPGDFKFRDIDKNGKIDAQDRTSLGRAFPNLMYGFNLSGSYRGFDLSMVFNGLSGNQIFNQNKLAAGISGGGTAGNGIPNKPKEWVNRWNGAGTSNTVPRAIVTDPNDNKRPSSYFVEDGSYFRLRNIQLGYNINSSLVEKIGLDNLRFYISAQNLFTITKYSGYSPDLGSKNQDNTFTGLDLATYPQNKTYMVGLTLGL